MRQYYNNEIVPMNFMKFLYENFNRLAEIYKPLEHKWIDMYLNTSCNPTELPDETYMEFVKSPISPTAEFVQEFMKLCVDQHINNMFHIKCFNVDKIECINDNIINVDQRSDEWKELLKYYTCGNNSGINSYDASNENMDWVTFYYNLIRGCIVELMVIKNLDFDSLFPDKKVTKIMVGLVVEEKNKRNSNAIAPDLLLLLDSDEIVPVEIKCIVGEHIDNSCYRKNIHLATKQLESSVNILKSNIICNKGIILLVYVNNDRYDVKISIISMI
jgi:hypothetical protein